MSNRLELLRVFCAAADATNFRDAALRLGVSPQVVTRAVRELEGELGEPLFHRSTRGVQLTSYGQQLAGQAREAVGGVDLLFHRLSRRTPSQLAGIVRVAAPGAGRIDLIEALAPLLAQHPGLTLDLRFSQALADVVNQQIDVGVRVGRQLDNRFTVRPVRAMALRVCASPALIARTGVPATLEALQALPLTTLVDQNTGRLWAWTFAKGRQLSVPAPAFITDDVDGECAAVLAGIGFGQLVGTMAEPHLASGALVEVLADQAPEPWPMHVYRVQRAPVPARVRLVFDELVRVLGGTPAA